MVLHEGSLFVEAVTRAVNPESPQPSVEHQSLDKVRDYLGAVGWYGADLGQLGKVSESELRVEAARAKDWDRITAYQPSLFN